MMGEEVRDKRWQRCGCKIGCPRMERYTKEDSQTSMICAEIEAYVDIDTERPTRAPLPTESHNPTSESRSTTNGGEMKTTTFIRPKRLVEERRTGQQNYKEVELDRWKYDGQFRRPKRLPVERRVGRQSRADAKKEINTGYRFLYFIEDDDLSDGDKVHFTQDSDMAQAPKKKV